jgi:hypothetical protein
LALLTSIAVILYASDFYHIFPQNSLFGPWFSVLFGPSPNRVRKAISLSINDLRQISILGGCVKSAFGVATGLSFLTFCALHKKEIESTWISRHGQNKDRQRFAQI